MGERHTKVRGFQILNDSVKEEDLQIYNAPSVGKILGYTANGMEWLDNPTLSIIYGASSTYLRIGDANTTSHSLASEDDLMITGKLEVDGLIYFDNHLQIHSQNELRLFDDDNSHYVGFKAPALTATKIWTLPDADGTNGQVLKTNGAGVLDWATVGGGEYITKDINQSSHGFSVGNVLYYTGSAYAKAKSDAESTAEVVGIVSAVAGVDDFTICSGGYISGLSGLTAGTVYYLSDVTAGALTATEPTTEGSISKPVLIAVSTTAGYFYNMRGYELGDSSTSYYKSFTNSDLSSGILTITHNLGHKYCQVQVFDENDKLIDPDEVELQDENSLDIDLSSYGTLTGTWHAVIIDIGSSLSITNVSYAGSFTNSDLSSGVLTINHSLNSQYNIVQIIDNSGNNILPDEVTHTDANNTAVDLSSYGTISGTWRYIILATGSANTVISTKIQDADFDTSIDVESTSDIDEIVGKVAGVEAFRIHNNGVIDFPKQAICRVYGGGSPTTQTIGTGTFVTVQLDTTLIDTQSKWDAGNYRYEVPEDGYYLVSGVIHWQSTDAGKAYASAIFVNSTQQTFDYVPGDGASRASSVSAVVLECSAGDYIYLKAFQDSGGDENIELTLWTQLSIVKVG